jgi:hypothetical protein
MLSEACSCAAVGPASENRMREDARLIAVLGPLVLFAWRRRAEQFARTGPPKGRLLRPPIRLRATAQIAREGVGIREVGVRAKESQAPFEPELASVPPLPSVVASRSRTAPIIYAGAISDFAKYWNPTSQGRVSERISS